MPIPLILTKFLPLLLLGFYATLFSSARRQSQVVTIGASLTFYGWFESEYSILLMSSIAANYLLAIRIQIEDAVQHAGFEFLGTPSQSPNDQAHQDDSPYVVIGEGTDRHTQQMIGFLKARGYATQGIP